MVRHYLNIRRNGLLIGRGHARHLLHHYGHGIVSNSLNNAPIIKALEKTRPAIMPLKFKT